MSLDSVLEKNLLPEVLIRLGVRRLLKQRLKDEYEPQVEEQQKKLMNLVNFLKSSPIAVNTQEANEQHYEVPAEFFEIVLGKHLKYSSGLWNENTNNLDDAEESMLELTCVRADLQDGDDILELGCGWGSLTLYMADKYPHSRITAVSNSKSQKDFIEKRASEKGLENISIITSDMNDFETELKFDKVISIEMFEHMRNYKELFSRIYEMLNPGGRLFIHIFSHNKYAYLFEVKDSTDWMSKYFFTGGIMPSDNLMLYFLSDFELENHWVVNGKNYKKTADEWLRNMDNNRDIILEIFSQTYGKESATKWFSYWRIFFISCAELWGYNDGKEWYVSHYLIKKSDS